MGFNLLLVLLDEMYGQFFKINRLPVCLPLCLPHAHFSKVAKTVNMKFRGNPTHIVKAIAVWCMVFQRDDPMQPKKRYILFCRMSNERYQLALYEDLKFVVDYEL